MNLVCERAGLGLELLGLVGSGKVVFGLGWYGWAGHGRVW